MLERDARERMCCGPPAVARVAADVVVEQAYTNPDVRMPRCMGSLCMGWRDNHSPNLPGERDGYCGVAGHRGVFP
jgi:hypothetical protein